MQKRTPSQFYEVSRRTLSTTLKFQNQSQDVSEQQTIPRSPDHEALKGPVGTFDTCQLYICLNDSAIMTTLYCYVLLEYIPTYTPK